MSSEGLAGARGGGRAGDAASGEAEEAIVGGGRRQPSRRAGFGARLHRGRRAPGRGRRAARAGVQPDAVRHLLRAARHCARWRRTWCAMRDGGRTARSTTGAGGGDEKGGTPGRAPLQRRGVRLTEASARGKWRRRDVPEERAGPFFVPAIVEGSSPPDAVDGTSPARRVPHLRAQGLVPLHRHRLLRVPPTLTGTPPRRWGVAASATKRAVKPVTAPCRGACQALG